MFEILSFRKITECCLCPYRSDPYRSNFLDYVKKITQDLEAENDLFCVSVVFIMTWNPREYD